MTFHKRNLLTAFLVVSSLASSVFAGARLHFNHNDGEYYIINGDVAGKVGSVMLDGLDGIDQKTFQELCAAGQVDLKQVAENTFQVTQKQPSRPTVVARGALADDDIQVDFNKKGFFVIHNDVSHKVLNYNVDKKLYEIARRGNLQKFFAVGGYIEVIQSTDGKFRLALNGRLLGGGPLFGAFMYGLVNAVGWVATAAVTTGAVTTSGPVTGAVIVAEGVGLTQTLATGAGLYFGACPFLP